MLLIARTSTTFGFGIFSSLFRSSTVKRIFDNCDTYLGFVDTGTFRNRHGIHLRTPKSEDLDYFEGLLAAKIEAYGSSKDYLEYVSIRELAESIQNSKGRVLLSTIAYRRAKLFLEKSL